MSTREIIIWMLILSITEMVLLHSFHSIYVWFGYGLYKANKDFDLL